jgi:hypothetical protein
MTYVKKTVKVRGSRPLLADHVEYSRLPPTFESPAHAISAYHHLKVASSNSTPQALDVQ